MDLVRDSSELFFPRYDDCFVRFVRSALLLPSLSLRLSSADDNKLGGWPGSLRPILLSSRQ